MLHDSASVICVKANQRKTEKIEDSRKAARTQHLVVWLLLCQQVKNCVICDNRRKWHLTFQAWPGGALLYKMSV